MPARAAFVARVLPLAFVLAAVGCAGDPPGAAVAIDLIERFDAAEKHAPASDALQVTRVTIAGETRRVVRAPPPSRLVYRLSVPEHAWLYVFLALEPEVWEQSADGAVFFVGVSDGERYEQPFTRLVDPRQRPDDRRWLPVQIDLAPYAGREVEVILNTRAGPPGRESDASADAAVWGEPRIVVVR